MDSMKGTDRKAPAGTANSTLHRVGVGRRAGVWIDGSEAVIIAMEQGEITVSAVKNDQVKHKTILNLEHSGTRSGSGAGAHFINQEKKELGKLQHEMRDYLDRVLKVIGSAEQVIVFGPAQAKIGLDKLIQEQKPRIACERQTTGPMTRNQKVAWVKRYFSGT